MPRKKKTLIDYVSEGNFQKVKYLLKKGADVHIHEESEGFSPGSGMYKVTPLSAAKYNYEMKQLLINEINDRMMKACEDGNIDEVQNMITAGIDGDIARRWFEKSDYYLDIKFLKYF